MNNGNRPEPDPANMYLNRLHLELARIQSLYKQSESENKQLRRRVQALRAIVHKQRLELLERQNGVRAYR